MLCQYQSSFFCLSYSVVRDGAFQQTLFIYFFYQSSFFCFSNSVVRDGGFKPILIALLYILFYLYIKYVLINCIEQQFNAFLKGFKTVCDSELFQKYSSSELELLICGSKEFDFDALESSTRYQDGLHKNSRIVRDFWCIVHGLSDNDKRKLLSFCTGSDRVPINGLGELTLTISKNGNDNNKLPTSHTCFNHLLLPEYSTKDILKTRLLTAIQNSEGFGLL